MKSIPPVSMNVENNFLNNPIAYPYMENQVNLFCSQYIPFENYQENVYSCVDYNVSNIDFGYDSTLHFDDRLPLYYDVNNFENPNVFIQQCPVVGSYFNPLDNNNVVYDFSSLNGDIQNGVQSFSYFNYNPII